MSKIRYKDLDKMFSFTTITRNELHGALLQMVPKCLKTKQMRDEFDPTNITRNTCYFVSECAYWFLVDSELYWKPMGLKIPGDSNLHRYLYAPNIQGICDLTCDQFPDYSLVNYENGKYACFLQTGTKGPSKRARELAIILGEDTWHKQCKYYQNRLSAITKASLF